LIKCKNKNIGPKKRTQKNISIYYIFDYNRNNQKSKNANEKKSKTIPGISKWFEWNWPITGQFAGYIRARSLPHIGKWIDFSPAQICDTIHRPSPTTSDSTKPKTPWVTPIPKKIGYYFVTSNL
jgi:hypothetical protein